MSGPCWRKRDPKFRETEANGKIFLCAPRAFLCASCYFGAYFGALADVQNVTKWACWKDLPVYFPTQLEFLNLVLICPSKYLFSQDYFVCVKKVAERPFLSVF